MHSASDVGVEVGGVESQGEAGEQKPAHPAIERHRLLQCNVHFEVSTHLKLKSAMSVRRDQRVCCTNIAAQNR